MSTNYYFYPKADCVCCGRSFDPLHIGMFSSGWAFFLHVIPEKGINTLNDWKKLWSASDTYIKDEYGNHVSIADMELIITKDRFWKGEPVYHAEIDGHRCVGRGDGPWDYFVGEFS